MELKSLLGFFFFFNTQGVVPSSFYFSHSTFLTRMSKHPLWNNSSISRHRFDNLIHKRYINAIWNLTLHFWLVRSWPPVQGFSPKDRIHHSTKIEILWQLLRSLLLPHNKTVCGKLLNSKSCQYWKIFSLIFYIEKLTLFLSEEIT